MYLQYTTVVEISIICKNCGAELEVSDDSKVSTSEKWILAAAVCECCKPEKEEVE